MICPKCRQSFEGNPPRCPHCGAYFVDGFDMRLHDDSPLKKAFHIVSLVMMFLLAATITVLFIMLFGMTSDTNVLFYPFLITTSILLANLIFAVILFFKNRGDDILSFRGNLVWSILTMLIGDLPLGILFLIRTLDGRKRLYGGEE